MDFGRFERRFQLRHLGVQLLQVRRFFRGKLEGLHHFGTFALVQFFGQDAQEGKPAALKPGRKDFVRQSLELRQSGGVQLCSGEGGADGLQEPVRVQSLQHGDHIGIAG